MDPNLELQVHLAEYNALRAESLELIKWRDSLVFISLGICGAIFSFQFSKEAADNLQIKQGGFYLIAPLSSLIGGLWMVNTWRINRIGLYIGQILSNRISQLLSKPNSDSILKQTPVFEWQTSNARLKYKWQRRIAEWLIYVATFIMPGILAQLLIYKNSRQIIAKRVIYSLEFTEIFYLNWILIGMCSILFIYYLLNGFVQKKKKIIELIY